MFYILTIVTHNRVFFLVIPVTGKIIYLSYWFIMNVTLDDDYRYNYYALQCRTLR